MKKYYFLIIVVLILGLVLTGCTLLSNISQVPTSDQSEITYLTKGGPTVDEAESFPLFAGQDMLVGNVLVWDDGEELCVRYELSEAALADGWLLYETHLAVAADLSGIPTNKAGNPKVGKFPYGDDDLGGVESYEECEIPIPDVECDVPFVIAAHAAIEKHEGCNEIGDVYGIKRNSGEVYGVDVLTGETALIFTTVAPPTSNVGPNGLAYDGENKRFYYCDYTGTRTLYFWDGTQELVAGPLPYGNIAAADFDDGKYYFITGPPKSDDLYEVIFDANGYIAGITKLANIANNEHGWTFNGDIAVKDGMVYGWGLCGKSGHGYEFFTYDLSTPGTFATVIKTAYQASLQLAFGLDDELYGHRSGGDGEFFVIDTTTGAVGSAVCNTGGVLFTDCASGAICIPDMESQTAWGAVSEGEIEIVEGKSWATYFNYTVECPPCLTPEGSLTVTGPSTSDSTWCPCNYKYDLTAMEAPVALKGWVDTSAAAVANTGGWSKYYAKFYIIDSFSNRVDVVFGNDWLPNPWYTMAAQQWDRIRLENNMGLAKPLQYYATVGGVVDRELDGTWVGAGNGVQIFPSDQNYFFQLIADPALETFTLQVLAMGSSAPANPPDDWPKQNMFDEAKWLDIGSIDVGSDFDFTEVSICAELWASTQAGAAETSTITWEDMEVDVPELW
ncbi:unnamed protein product [marine sediment metagenome]|uniref:Uncharacterized protein n=1 Tax=marine sediment metagenome TaxID=412755 RepID=X1AWH3_9ZZZZ